MKKNLPVLVLGLFIALLLVLYMVSYQVAFNEMAVVTTFGKAGEGAVKNGGGGGAGLYWKWPYPIQDVRRFDTRVRMLEDRLEEQQTRDRQVVIASTYVAWRITRPLDFMNTLGSPQEAEKSLRARLRDARSVIGNFSFDELANGDPKRLKLAEAEAAMLKKLQLESDQQQYGIRIETVGIKRNFLPAEVTKVVFERMRSTRETLAQDALSEGDAKASDLLSKARGAEQRILHFVKGRAQEIRAEGDKAATRYYETFRRNEEFAIFLRQMDALKQTLSHNTTFVLDTEISPFELLAPERVRPKPPDEEKRPLRVKGR